MTDPVGYDGLAAPVLRNGKVDLPQPLFLNDNYDTLLASWAATGSAILLAAAGAAVTLAVRWFRGRTHREV